MKTSYLRVALLILVVAILILGGYQAANNYRTSCHIPPRQWAVQPSAENGSIVLAATLQIENVQGSALMMINPDGTPGETIDVPMLGLASPAWSPDGKKVAFSVLNPNNSIADIFSWETQSVNARMLFESSRNDFWPDWLNEHTIIYVEMDDISQSVSEIYRLDLQTGEKVRLSKEKAFDFEPKVSPDGKEIVFISKRDGNNEIYLMNADGGNIRRLTHNAASDVNPAWSPDGQYIVFASNRNEQWDIYAMQHDGSNQCPLTDSAAPDMQPTWSPDGKKIAFISDNFSVVIIMDVDGGNPHVAFNAQIDIAELKYPDWKAK